MKPLFIITIILFAFQSYSQEKIRRYYTFGESKIFDGERIYLSKEELTPFKKLDKKYQDKIKGQVESVKQNLTESVELLSVTGNKLIIKKEQAMNEKLYDSLAMKIPLPAKLSLDSCNCGGQYKGTVLFEKSKLYINPWNFSDKKIIDDEKELFFELKDGQTAILNFKEYTLTTLVIPLKYRFRDDPIIMETLNEEMETVSTEIKIPETFTASFNVGVFMGKTWGKTKFNHNKKTGNREFTTKKTFGILLGTTAEKLTKANTDGSDDAPKDSEEVTIGLFSPGLGYVWSWNKFAIGFFAGFDFGVGEISDTWNYDNRPWLGVGIGYDVLKL